MNWLPAYFFICLCGVNAYAADFRECKSAPLPSDLPSEGFAHRFNRVGSKLKPRHSINDVLAVFGKPSTIEAKFNYGILGADVYDEIVEVWIDNCGARYKMIHRGKTDKDGRFSWIFPHDLVEKSGEYRIWLRLVGDGSGVLGTIRLVSGGAKVAVFDVDGTLTSHESDVTLNILSELIKGCFSPPKRAFASELTHLFYKQGYQIVYLTGRHYFLNELTRKWLALHGFAPGTVLITNSLVQIAPNQNSVGTYKSAQLSKIKSAGLFIARAYGNAWTDISRYKEAGIPSSRIFVIGKNSGSWGVTGLGCDYEAHYKQLNAESALTQ